MHQHTRFQRILATFAGLAMVLVLPSLNQPVSGQSAAHGEQPTMAGAQAPSAQEAARSLAPSGRLRVAINLGNSVLAQRAPDGTLKGISVDLARALAGRLNLPYDLIPYAAAGQVFDALDQGAWDLAFMAMEPERATKVEFSQPYISIDSTYLVRKDSVFQKSAELDRPGVRIAVGRGAAYDLYLTRNLKQAELRRYTTSVEAMQGFMDEQLEAAGGIRQALADFARDKPQLRLLDDNFSAVQQAIGVPKGRAAAAAYIRAFLEERQRGGAVAR